MQTETQLKVCITVENSPNPSSVYIRLCKHGKNVFYCSNKITSSKKYNAGKDKKKFILLIKMFLPSTLIWQWHFSTDQSKLTFENLVIGDVTCLQLVLVSNIHQRPKWNLGNLRSFLNFSFKDLTAENVSLKVFKFAAKRKNLYVTQPVYILSCKHASRPIRARVLSY